MKLLLNMNLAPAWCDLLRARGHEVVHWSTEGDPRATDRSIMEFAAARGYERERSECGVDPSDGRDRASC